MQGLTPDILLVPRGGHAAGHGGSAAGHSGTGQYYPVSALAGPGRRLQAVYSFSRWGRTCMSVPPTRSKVAPEVIDHLTRILFDAAYERGLAAPQHGQP